MESEPQLLAAYDAQLRGDAETPGAVSLTRCGPLRLVTFAGGRGFVSYRDLGGGDADEIRLLVDRAVRHFRNDGSITRVEWKSRGHDHAPELHESLLAKGFEPEASESIMVGSVTSLTAPVRLPPGVTLRVVTEENEVRAMSAMTDFAFGEPVSSQTADAYLRRLSRNDGMQLWVAECEGEMISAGRIEPVPGSEFAGIWGGATVPLWRGRGIYRALTAARARVALGLGKKYLHSDSTEYSRPILQRAGLLKVSTTKPYQLRLG